LIFPKSVSYKVISSIYIRAKESENILSETKNKFSFNHATPPESSPKLEVLNLLKNNEAGFDSFIPISITPIYFICPITTAYFPLKSNATF
jgi:hypothetical protein